MSWYDFLEPLLGLRVASQKIYFILNPITAGLWNDVKCWDRAIMALDWLEPILKNEKMS